MEANKLIFMVYDSRSGSTFLSKLISQQLINTAVTPEIGFEEILKRSDQTLNGLKWSKVLRRMVKNDDMRNADCSFDNLIDLYEKQTAKLLPENVFKAVIDQCLKNYKSRFIIIKNGRHIKYINELSRLLGDKAKIIYITRDPRAVISSKLLTKRPYYPYEVMAWGGALFAAMQWKRYDRYITVAIKNEAANILEVSYEDLITSQNSVLTKVAAFIGTTIKLKDNIEEQNNYRIPEKEKEIHRLASSNAVSARVNAWQQEITSYQVKQIESILSKIISQKGYQLRHSDSSPGRLLVILFSFPELVFKTTRHYFLRFKYSLFN